MSMRWDCVSEPRTPTGLLSVPRLTCQHGESWWRLCLGETPDSSTRALWQSYQQIHLGASRRNGRRSENFAYQYLRYVKGCFTCRKILRHGASGFTSHQKEGVLRIFIALKTPSPMPVLNPRPLGLVASILSTTPPRRLCAYMLRIHICHCILLDAK
jgi:hypothetical protein